MKFNINNCVKVKLTDWGLEVHKKHHDKFLPAFINLLKLNFKKQFCFL